VHTLLRTPATVVWFVLIAATAFSWTLGTDHGLGSGAQQLASVAILAVAFIKIRFIGLYFMELREAPHVLRGLFETYCLVVGTIVICLFLFAA
jgi:hypothetical protein